MISTRPSDLSTIPSQKSTQNNPGFSGYLVGPLDQTTPYTPKKAFINGSPMELVVYQYCEDVTIVLLLPLTPPLSLQFYSNVSHYLEDSLPALKSVLEGDWISLQSESKQDQRYIYHNATNKAYKTSIGTTKSALLPSSVISSLGDVHEQVSKSGVVEVNVKESDDCLVCGVREDGREFYNVVSKFEGGIGEVADGVV